MGKKLKRWAAQRTQEALQASAKGRRASKQKTEAATQEAIAQKLAVRVPTKREKKQTVIQSTCGAKCTNRMLFYEVAPNVTVSRVLEHVNRLEGNIRPGNTWEERLYSPRRNLADLLRHMFAVYRTPLFLDSVFYQNNFSRVMPVYSHVAGGGNIRKYLDDRYTVLTKKMAHTLITSPSELDFVSAIRRAQIQALGGDSRLWNKVRQLNIGRALQPLPREKFWVTVYQWFANNAMIDPEQIGPLCDFISFKKGENGDYAMKGRSPLRMLKDMHEWHGNITQMKRYHNVPAEFQRSGIKPFQGVIQKKDPRSKQKYKETYFIEEILTRKELFDEGNAMRHCVASYGQSIADGRCSIWRMRKVSMGASERLMTIEVASKAVVQVRGKRNISANPQERRIIDQWAVREGLASSYSNGRW